MEKPLIVVLDGFDATSLESTTSRFTKGEGFTIVPRRGGRLEFRLTGAGWWPIWFARSPRPRAPARR